MPSRDEVAPSSPAAHPRAWSWAKSGSAEPTGVAGIASRQQPLRARADSPLASATANAHVTFTEQCLCSLCSSSWQCSDPPSKTVHALTCGPCTVCSSTSLHAHGTLWTCHKHRCVTHCRMMARVEATCSSYGSGCRAQWLLLLVTLHEDLPSRATDGSGSTYEGPVCVLYSVCV